MLGLRPRGRWCGALVARTEIVVIVVAIHQGPRVKVDGLELWPLGAAAVPVEADAVVALIAAFEASVQSD